MTGAFFGDRHGIAPEVLLGDLFRVLGADGVIYPNVGGRFPFNDRTCHAINERLRGELGGLRRSFPTPGGGIDVKIVPHWLAQYGPDTILLIGGSLYIQSDLSDATRKLVEALDLFTERVEQFVEREKNFTRDASHELRTPLAVIKSSTALLEKRGGLDPA